MNRSFKTQEEISSLLSLSVDERQELSDRSLRGLMLIKRKNGGVKWFLKYLCPRTHQKRSQPLGIYPEMGLHEARQAGMALIRSEFESDPFELVTLSGNTLGGELGFLSAEELGGMGGNGGKARSAEVEGSIGTGGIGEAVGTDPAEVVSAESAGVLANVGSDDDLGVGRDGNGSGTESAEEVQGLKTGEDVGSRGKVTVLGHDPALAPTPLGQIRPFITLRQFVSDHYLPYIKVAKRSWATDVSVLKNHILPMLGGYVMIDLKPFVVQEMVQSLSKKGLSASTCNRALIILRFMFNCALRWEVLPKIDNPCKNVKELTLNNKVERFLNGNEISTLKLELSKSKNKFLPYIVQLLILTGCRRGEALNAQIQHFDLGRGDWVVPLPKAGKARHIPLNDMAIQTIRAALIYKQSYNQVTKESHYLFPNPSTGEPFQQIFYSWDKARKAAHIDTVRMHDLRHSFASAMVNSGMTLYDVKEILGHSNIRTTERYAHLSNSRLRQAAESVTSFYDNQDWIGNEAELVW